MHLITQPLGSWKLGVGSWQWKPFAFGGFLKPKPLRFHQHRHQKPYDSTVGLCRG